jgi:hypothetical protein
MDNEKETLEIGLIGLGEMGLMYAKRMVSAGWKKYELPFPYTVSFLLLLINQLSINRVNVCDQHENYEKFKELLKG